MYDFIKNELKVVKILKILDKFLKFLKTDRNTFFTYVLTLVTAYLVVDRVVEMLLMIFTGMGHSYWGPIQYTLALACPVFAFLFSGSSKFADCDEIKLTFFDVYLISLYILIISMVTQWVNQAGWMLLISVPNYAELVTNFSNLIRPAFSALAVYFPLTTFYPLVKWLIGTVHDTKNIVDSIYDYGGIDLSDKSAGTGQYTCEVEICKDSESGKIIKISEDKRFYQMLVVGVSGSGKTSLIFEPMIARDIDKKFFFSEISKEMGFTALKTGIATLSKPYDNEYLNKHFNLNMLIPVESKLNLYNTYMNKMILNKSNSGYTYRNLGLTYMCPDYESMTHMIKVADSYKLPYNIVDPNDPNSIGLNPFIFDDPLQTSIAISTVLKGLYSSTHSDINEAYRENAATQAVENVSILLKEIYPRLHDGELPTLEDVQDCLTDFELTESLCERLKEDEELAKKYSALIRYFEMNFYKNSNGIEEMRKFVTASTAQLDTLLRFPGVKNILCNRTNNLNYDEALENGEITFVCTRRGDLGPNINTAFGLFFILLMQYSVLRRPGTEKTRVPHFLYIDEFSNYINASTEPLFTLYRKYRVATVISVQNLAQLEVNNNKYKQTILSNCNNKIVFGNNTPEDNEWWSKEIGDKKEWDYTNTYDTAKGEYSPNYGNIGYKYKIKYSAGKIQTLKFKQCAYKIKNLKGKNETGKGLLNFLSASFSEPKNVKEYNFNKFISGGIDSKSSDTAEHKKKMFGKKPEHFKDDVQEEIDPINTDTTDSNFLFDNEDAIVINFKKNK